MVGSSTLALPRDSAWQRAHELRMAARKALIEIDAKSRVARAQTLSVQAGDQQVAV